jgi:hypothetical protein
MHYLMVAVLTKEGTAWSSENRNAPLAFIPDTCGLYELGLLDSGHWVGSAASLWRLSVTYICSA